MASNFVKNRLKLARDALGKKDYEAARGASVQILETDPTNYNAHVFYGLSLLELGQTEQSEQSYRKAIVLNSNLPLAWQGIAKLYEQTGQWDRYAEALEQLMQLFAKSTDAIKCAENLQKFVDLQRERSSRLGLADALSLFLPQSSLYSVLSNLPPPDSTSPTSTSTFVAQSAIHDSLPVLEEIVSLLEKDEDETFTRDVEKWRKRLNAPSPEIIRKQVGREIWGKSRLPEYYNEILNHPNTSDQLRRETESKFFCHKEKYLYVLPLTGDQAQTKHKIAEELNDLVNGVVLLGIPDESAWSFYLEGQDFYSTEEYNISNLQRFVKLFPESALSKILKGYFAYMTIPILDLDDPDPDGKEERKLTDGNDDPLEMMLDAFNDLQNSILSHRILTDIYCADSDYENCIKLAESGLELVRRSESDRGNKLPRTRKAFEVALATSLVGYYPSKHHTRALQILDDILSEDPDNVPCLMGRAYILQHSQRWLEAKVLFSRVHGLLPHDANNGLRAREENAWCIAQSGNLDAASSELQDVRIALDELDGREADQARCWWRLGKCFWDLGDESKEQAYQYFITSLKRSSSFAPAFTSLGIYYAEFLSPPDPNRASKCFQKAFELDAREVEAARRLAEGFAEEREWDLVEVVARRTIEGEGGLSGGADDDQKIAIARFLPVNAWAWKAIGVVELNRHSYATAIQSFQVALRGEPEDQLSWLRLGEAYSKAGRHAAAVKALDRAHELLPDDWICVYLMGKVQAQTSHYKESIDSFKYILAEHPSESGVLLSLSSAYLDLGCNHAATCFTSRAEDSFLSSIETALSAIDSSPGFRRVAWKVVADSLYHLANINSFTDLVRIHDALSSVKGLVTASPSSGLFTLPILTLDIEHATTGLHILDFSVAAYDHRISFGFLDDKAKASAWFDLGIALQSWGNRNETLKHRKAALELAIKSLKQAILVDPGNELHWIALGNVYFETNAKSAQHAYIKGLDINAKNVETWTNLGLLYLHHEDLELANEAFYRAQTLDPDYALAWVGQGLVATSSNRDSDAENLFEHAVGLGTTIPEADVEYASRLFFRWASVSEHRTTSPSLLPAFFVLDRYCKQRPQDASAVHLFSLVCERVGHYELAIQLIERTISILETAYEENEDPVIERQFTIANTNIARLRVATHDYAHAIDSFESALGLLGEDDSELSSILRTQCHFGSGLAHFKLGALEDAMVAFENSLEAAGDNLRIKGHVTVLLAQTLWAIDTDETRESAKSHLLQCIASDPENLEAINALVGMGILTADEGLVDAALSEILSLPLHRRHEMDPRRDVVGLLVKHHLGQGDSIAALSEAQKAVFADPASAELRHKAASLALQEGHFTSALAILTRPTLLSSTSEVSKSLALRAIAECLGGKGGISEATKLVQKALVLDPANVQNWRILAFVRSSIK